MKMIRSFIFQKFKLPTINFMIRQNRKGLPLPITFWAMPS